MNNDEFHPLPPRCSKCQKFSEWLPVLSNYCGYQMCDCIKGSK